MGLPKLSVVDSTGTDRREGYFYDDRYGICDLQKNVVSLRVK